MADLNILIFGDVVGKPGRALFQKHLPALKKQYNAECVIVNGENSANNARGITPATANFLLAAGADVITTGNHVWDQREIQSYFNEPNVPLIRPANFPSQCPGKGVFFVEVSPGVTVGVINLQGRVFMRELGDCPFKTAESLLTFVKSKTNIVVIDFHAETTSEKCTFGHFMDGKVSAVVGTHTHVQTADHRILPKGTAYVTDLGCSGALESSLGVKYGPVLNNFLTQMPNKFEVEEQGPFVFCGLAVTVDTDSGRAKAVSQIRIIDETLVMEVTEAS